MPKNASTTKEQADAVLALHPTPDAETQAGGKAQSATDVAAATQAPPRLGEMIHVRVADGLALLNNETGQDFVPGEATMQTVTVTTLRRLADGDLVRV